MGDGNVRRATTKYRILLPFDFAQGQDDDVKETAAKM
jgi:hypothetical protein